MCDVRTRAQEFEKLPRATFSRLIFGGGEGGRGASEKKFASLAVAWGEGEGVQSTSNNLLEKI
jgi:hypothetical protein